MQETPFLDSTVEGGPMLGLARLEVDKTAT